MSYTPTNPVLYSAAYNAALAGMASSLRVSVDSVALDYVNVAAIAGAWAQAYDSAWGSAAAPDMIAVILAWQESYGVWEGRGPVAGRVTDYAAIVGAIIGQAQAAEAYFAGQGIVPPAWPTSGGSTTVGVPLNVIDGNVTIQANVNSVRCDTTGGASHLTLPDVTTIPNGRRIDLWLAVSPGVPANAMTVASFADEPIMNPDSGQYQTVVWSTAPGGSVQGTLVHAEWDANHSKWLLSY